MTLELIHETTVAEHWVCPIEYGDMTGLEDDEEAELGAWLAEFKGCTFEWGERTEFAKDEVSGLMAACVEVKIWRMRK